MRDRSAKQARKRRPNDPPIETRAQPSATISNSPDAEQSLYRRCDRFRSRRQIKRGHAVRADRQRMVDSRTIQEQPVEAAFHGTVLAIWQNGQRLRARGTATLHRAFLTVRVTAPCRFAAAGLLRSRLRGLTTEFCSVVRRTAASTQHRPGQHRLRQQRCSRHHNNQNV